MLGIGKNFREAIWKNLDQRQAKIQGTPGLLGDGSGNVAVPGLQNYVYVRIAGGVIQVFNNRVPLVNDLPVVVGYDPLVPGRLQVLSTQADLGIMSQVITPSSGFAPSSRYRWMDPNGGEDPLFVEQRQMMPLRLYPAGGLSVAVYPAVVKTPRGYYLVGGNTTYDLTSLLPSSEGVRFIVFYLDDQGQIQYQAGNTVAWNDFDLSQLPQLGGNAVYLIGAVRLYYGQTEIREGRVNTDILDLRLCRKSIVLKGNQSALETLSVEEGTLAYALDTARLGVYIGTQWQWMGIADWADIQNKPVTFPPSAHTHPLDDITGHTKAAHDALGIDADTVDGQHASAFAQAVHTHTPGEVGLGNVTNDAQLKRAGNDFTGFTEKTTPADNDLILSEDSAASYAKKKITLGNIYLWLKGRFDSLYAALSHNHDASYYTKTQLNTSGAGGAVHWDNVTSKPSTFPPSTHQHAASDVTSGVFDAARIPNLDASKITSGTLSTDRFSAYADLEAENYFGFASNQIARNVERAIAIRAVRNTTQTIPDATWTRIVLNNLISESKPLSMSSQWDSANGHFIVRRNGWYALFGAVTFAANSTGYRYVGIAKNNSVTNTLVNSGIMALSNVVSCVAVNTVAYLTSGETVSLWATQNSGGNLNAVYSYENWLYLAMVLLFPA